MANVDFKITTWERIEIEDDVHVEIVKKAIQDGKITNGNDLSNLLQELGQETVYCDVMEDCSEQMSKEKNEGEYTIVLQNDNGDDLATN